MSVANLSAKRTVSFWARGDGGTYHLVALAATAGGGFAGLSFFRTEERWQHHEVEFADLGTDGSDLQGLLFTSVLRPGTFAFQIDEVRID